MPEKRTGILKVAGHVYTLFVVVIGWTLFRAPSLQIAATYLKTMFGIGAETVFSMTTLFYLKDNWMFFLCAILFSVPIAEKIRKYKGLYQGLLALLFLISLIYIIKGSYSPFIYFSF